MPPQELQIIVSAVNRMGPVIDNISQGIQRLIALQEQSAVAAQTNAQATAQLLAVQQQVVQAIQALGTSLQQVSAKHTEAAGAAQRHAQAERSNTEAITEEDKALREHIRLLEAMVGLRAQQVRFAEATGSSTVAVAAMKQQIDALRAVEQGYRQLASTLDSSSVEYVKLQTAAVRAGTEMAQVQQKIDASIQTTIDHMRKQREETERMYAAMGKQAPTVNDMLIGRQPASISKPAVDATKQMNAELQKQIQLLEATAALRKEEASLAATGGKQGMQAYVASLKAQREALMNLDSGYQSMMASLSKTSPEYLKAATASARTRTEIAGLNDTIAKGAGQYEILGMSVEKLGRRVREALVFFVAFRIFWEAWNFVTQRMRDLFDLEQQLKRVQSATIFDPSGMAKLNDLTVVMTSNMARFGTSVKETADAMYELISAGISWVETQEGLPTVLGLVKLGVSDVGTASRAVSAIYKTWGTDFEDIGDIISTVLITTQSEIGGFVTAFQRVAATAKLAGLDFKQTAALVGILNDAMIFGGNAGRALRQGLSQIAQERDYLQKMGVVIDATKDMGEQIDFVAVQLGQLLGQGKISTAQLGELFKRLNIQGAQAIAAIAVMADKYKEVMIQIQNGKGAMAEMLDVRMDNAINQWDRLTAAVTGYVNAMVSGEGHLASFLRLYANMISLGPKEGADLFGTQELIKRIRETDKEVRRLQETVNNLSKMPITDPLVAKDLFQAKVALSGELEKINTLIRQAEDGYKSLGPEARKQVESLIERWKTLYTEQKKVVQATVAPKPPAEPVKDYETITKEVRAAVALLEARADLRKTQAKLLETSGRESDMQKSLQMQRDAIIQLDTGIQKQLPLLHKGTEEWLRLATASAKNKIEIAGLNEELLQFGSQFQMSERSVVSIAGSIGLLETKTRESRISLKEQTEQTQTFGITMWGLQKPIAVVSKELEDLGNKYDKTGTAAAKNAVFLDRQNQAAMNAAMRAADLREKEARASGMFDAEKEAEIDRDRITAAKKRLDFLAIEIAKMQALRSEKEADVEVLERLKQEYDAVQGQLIDLNATQGAFWDAFSRGATTALSEMSRGFKETFGEAKTLMFDLQRTISDVLFDSITKGFSSATDGLKKFGETLLRYFTNQASKDLMRSAAGWMKGLLSGGGQPSSAFGVLGGLGGLLGVGNNPAATALQSGGNLFGMVSAGGNPGGFDLLGMGAAAVGGTGSAANLGHAAAGGGLGFGVGKLLGFGKAGQMGAMAGGAIGSAFLGPGLGTLIGIGVGLTIDKISEFVKKPSATNFVRSILPGMAFLDDKLFGGFFTGILNSIFGTTPKGKLDVDVLPFSRQALRSDLQTSGISGTRVGDVVANLGGNILKDKKENTLQEKLARMINEILELVVTTTVQLVETLPPHLGAELDAALSALERDGLEIVDKTWKGGKAAKKLKRRIKGLADEAIGDLVEALGFGDLDLKALGGGKRGDAVAGWQAVASSLGTLSEIVERAGPAVDVTAVSLERFTAGAIDLFKGFAQDGEEYIATVERISQGFRSLFGVMDQLETDIGMSAQSGFEGLVDVYQRSVRRIQELADAGLIAVETGASPDEIASAARALRDAMDTSMQVLAAIQQRLEALNTAIVTGVDLYADLEVRIRALDGAATSLDALIDEAYRLAIATHNLGAQINIFESVLQVVGSDFDTFTAALPRMAGAFNELFAAIRSGGNNTEAITQLQALAQAVTNGAQAAFQGITNGATRARDAAQSAADARIQALEDERAAIQEVAEEQEEANDAALDAIRQWKSIAESVKAQLVDLFNLLAPTHPESSFNEVLAQFRSAVGGFGPSSTPEAATNIQDLARQVLQLAQGVPGMDLPSAAFQSLAVEVKAALEAVKTVAENQPTEEDLLGQIVTTSSEQSTRLAEIDAAIKAEQAQLQQTLQSISAQEQAQIAFVNTQQTAALTQIREHLAARLVGLQAEQEAARRVLEEITGSLSFEQFIAQKQEESVLMLGQIRDVLRQYLGSIVTGLGFPVPALANGGIIMARPGGTLVRVGEGGYDEAIIPLRNGRSSGGETKIILAPNITISGANSNSKRELKAALMEWLQTPEVRHAVQEIIPKH